MKKWLDVRAQIQSISEEEKEEIATAATLAANSAEADHFHETTKMVEPSSNTKSNE